MELVKKVFGNWFKKKQTKVIASINFDDLDQFQRFSHIADQEKKSPPRSYQDF